MDERDIYDIIVIKGVPFPLQTFSVAISDLDAADGTGRSEGTATAYRDRIATKVTLSAGPQPLTGDKLKVFLAAMEDDFFEAEYPDPRTDDWSKSMFYCGDRKLNMRRVYQDGTRLWEIDPVELVEQ